MTYGDNGNRGIKGECQGLSIDKMPIWQKPKADQGSKNFQDKMIGFSVAGVFGSE